MGKSTSGVGMTIVIVMVVIVICGAVALLLIALDIDFYRGFSRVASMMLETIRNHYTGFPR